MAIFAALKAGAVVLAGQRFDQGRQARLHPATTAAPSALVTQHKLAAVAADALAEAPFGQARRLSPAASVAPALENAMHWREALATDATPPAFPASTSISR